MTLTRWMLIGWVLTGVGRAPLAAETVMSVQPVTLRAVFEESNWFVNVRVADGWTTAWMLVDSGSPDSYFANEFLPLAIPRTAATQSISSVGGGMAVASAVIPVAQIGPVTLTQWAVQVISGRQVAQMSTKRWIVGHLGVDVLKRYVVKMDPARSEFVCYPRAAYPASAVTWWPTRMAGTMPSIEVAIGDQTCWAAVDMGGGTGLKIKSEALEARVKPLVDRPLVDGGLSGITGEGRSRLSMVKEARVGPWTVERPMIEFIRLPGSPSEATIGTDLLAHVVTWWDLTGGRFGVDARAKEIKGWAGDAFDYDAMALEQHLMKGRWRDALTLSAALLAQYPSRGDYLMPRQVHCYSALKDTGRVDQLFAELLRPGADPFFWALRARHLAAQKDYPGALAAYDTAVKNGFPDDGVVLLRIRHEGYRAAGQQAEAFRVAQQGARRYPWEPWTAEALAIDQYGEERGTWASAVPLFELKVLTPSSTNARMELAAVYANVGRLEDALALIEEYRTRLGARLQDPAIAAWWTEMGRQPLFAPLKDHPRFLKALELPPAPVP